MIRSPVWSRQEFASPTLLRSLARKRCPRLGATDLIPAFVAMSDAAVLDGSRVAGSARAGQTQSRERHHADVSVVALRKARPRRAAICAPEHRTQARGGTLFLRLGGKLQRIALAAAGLGPARRLGLGDVPGIDGDHANAAPMGGHHHAIGLVLAHAELTLEHGDHELPRGVIVVEQNDLVQARPFRLQAYLGARLGGDVGHWRSGTCPMSAHGYSIAPRHLRTVATPRAIGGKRCA